MQISMPSSGKLDRELATERQFRQTLRWKIEPGLHEWGKCDSDFDAKGLGHSIKPASYFTDFSEINLANYQP